MSCQNCERLRAALVPGEDLRFTKAYLDNYEDLWAIENSEQRLHGSRYYVLDLYDYCRGIYGDIDNVNKLDLTLRACGWEYHPEAVGYRVIPIAQFDERRALARVGL